MKIIFMSKCVEKKWNLAGNFLFIFLIKYFEIECYFFHLALNYNSSDKKVLILFPIVLEDFYLFALKISFCQGLGIPFPCP